MLNKKFIDFSIKLLLKDKTEHFFSFFIFTFIVFILSTVLFVSDSIKFDLLSSMNKNEQILLKNTKAGRYAFFNESHIDEIIQFNGIKDVIGKVDGYYNFMQGQQLIHIVSDDELEDDEMLVSKDIKNLLASFDYEDEFNFLTSNETITKSITKVIDSNILSHNTIFVNTDSAREILEMSDDEYSYLSITVPNNNEIDFIARKINSIYPHVNAVVESIMQSQYRHIFYYKGGIFMIVYIVAMISFFILLKNQVSSLFGEKKREIAILRSLGFSIKDIILFKFLQNSIISICAFLVGVIGSYAFVFIFNAPLFKNIFLGDGMSYLEFTPVLDIKMLFLMFIFTVIPFLAFILIPSWKIAIKDISEIMK